MLCPYCGKNLMEGSTYCDGCGGTFNVQQPMPQQPMQQPMNNMYNNGYGYGYQQPPKKNNNVIIIVIVSILIIAGLVAGIVLLTGNSDDESNNTNTANNTVTNTNTNTNTNVNTNTNTNTVQPTPASTVSFLDYTLTVPNGFAAGEYSGNAYIQSNECLIMYMTYGMGYDTIIQNESVFLKSFKDNGLNITKSGSATFGSTKYYIIIGTLSGAEYGYMFSQMPNGKAFFATISSLNGGSIKDSYFQQAASFFATAR